jgi:HAD superfamily hydrolase (TIGR01549 family)
MSKITTIFFDFDGVLAESVNIKTEAFRQMYLDQGEDFADRVVQYHIENGGVSRFEKIKLYNGKWLGETLTEERISELANVFSNLVVDGVVNAKEVDGATNFLESSEKYTKYIITGTPTNEIKVILQRREMDHYFVGAYGSPEKKSYWVEKIMREQNLKPEECVFIGDALADWKAAKDNHLAFILRVTPEGESLFTDFKGARIDDLKGLHSVIEQLK